MEQQVNFLESMAFQAKGTVDIQHFVALTALGMCRALSSGLISPGYACNRFLGPALLTCLESAEVHPELRHAIHHATELEDIEHLVPDALSRAIADIESKLVKVLGELPTPPSEGEKWIVRALLPLD
jgi:hypothetical protein